ncbi:uncharacterized protein LOC117121244, partial [Anneissia japonica]|uniref:uncharacterized protein LOC117121244 n=1 Tax=Anneissia japonica TaxID=1529436 RepID=UPI00142564BD
MRTIRDSSSCSIEDRENRNVHLTTDYCLSNVISNVIPSPCQDSVGCQLHCKCTQEHPQSSFFSTSTPYSSSQNSTKMTHSEILFTNVSQYSNDSSPTSYSTWPNRQTSNIPRSWPSGRQTGRKMHTPVDTHPQVPTLRTSAAHPDGIRQYKYDGPGLVSFVQNGPVFITYSAASSKFIQNIHKALQMAGYSVLSDVKRSVLEQPESKTTEVEFKTMLTK